MKANIKRSNRPVSRPFPKLMYLAGKDDFIVLMQGKNDIGFCCGIGTVVSTGGRRDWKLGDHSTTWTLHLFSDFEGVLELSND